MGKITVGLMIADRNEFAPLESKAQRLEEYHTMTKAELEINGVKVIALLSGVGKVNAATGATCLAQLGVDCMLSAGYSGGIHGVYRNETLIGTQFVEHDFDLTPLGYEKGVKPSEPSVYRADQKLNDRIKSIFPGIQSGPMVCGDCFVCSDSLRSELYSRYGALSCDMETAAVASVCHKFGIPFAALRRISDDAGDSADALYKEAVHRYEDQLMDMVFSVINQIGEYGWVCGGEND